MSAPIFTATHRELGAWLDPTPLEFRYCWYQYMRKVPVKNRVKVEMLHKINQWGIKYTVLTFYYKKGNDDEH